jgi:Domain of unknown function (DUF5668)
MNDQPTNQDPSDPGPPSQPSPPPAEEPPSEPRTFEQRMEDLGRRAGAAGEKLGHEAEVAAQRWSKDPSVVAAGDTAARVWGLLVLAVGVWFFADITLGMEMPGIAWRDVWPVALIVLGLAVLVRGMASRRA